MKCPGTCLSVLLLLLSFASCSSDDDRVPSPPPDTTPPARVDDLLASGSGGDRLTLIWTAPGDDGVDGRVDRYDIRYAAAPLAGEGWDSAAVLGGPPLPKMAGQPESLEVAGLDDGTYHFALKAADEVPNWSGLSNVASAVVATTPAPQAVTDLSVCWGTLESLTLTWTAPGHDEPGTRLTRYDLRVATSPITGETWGAATPVEGIPVPADPGMPESFPVDGLELETTYHFSLRSADETPTWSDLSNDVSDSTSRLRRLTTHPDGGYGPSGVEWAPDGESVVLSAHRTGDWEIYRMSVGCGEPVRLTDSPGEDRFPACSPDGQRIAFASGRRGGPLELWVMNADGRSPVLLARHEGKDVQACTWSPDGARIAYQVGWAATIVTPTEIWVVPSGGGSPDRLVGDGEFANAYPAWSPDGERIAFNSGAGYRFDVWLLPLSGGSAVRLPTSCDQGAYPSWSPSGGRIAYMCLRVNPYDTDIWTMAADGGDRRQVTSGPARDWDPAWSPDGGRMAFVSNRSGRSEVWILQME